MQKLMNVDEPGRRRTGDGCEAGSGTGPGGGETVLMFLSRTAVARSLRPARPDPAPRSLCGISLTLTIVVYI